MKTRYAQFLEFGPWCKRESLSFFQYKRMSSDRPSIYYSLSYNFALNRPKKNRFHVGYRIYSRTPGVISISFG